MKISGSLVTIFPQSVPIDGSCRLAGPIQNFAKNIRLSLRITTAAQRMLQPVDTPGTFWKSGLSKALKHAINQSINIF